MQRRSQWVLVLGSLVVLLGLFPTASWACAVCWGGDDALAHGMNVSIVFLMSMPFLIGGSIIGILCIAYKRARGERLSSLSLKNLVWGQKEAQE
jgi:hypothetical protein